MLNSNQRKPPTAGRACIGVGVGTSALLLALLLWALLAPAAPAEEDASSSLTTPTYASNSVRSLYPLLHYELRTGDGVQITATPTSPGTADAGPGPAGAESSQASRPDLLRLSMRLPSKKEVGATVNNSSNEWRRGKEIVDVELRVREESVQGKGTEHPHIQAHHFGRVQAITSLSPALGLYRGEIEPKHLRILSPLSQHRRKSRRRHSHTQPQQRGWVELTLYTDGRFQMLLHLHAASSIGGTEVRDEAKGEALGETWQVEPVESLASEMEPAKFQALLRDASGATAEQQRTSDPPGEGLEERQIDGDGSGGRGMVLFNHADLIGPRSARTSERDDGATDPASASAAESDATHLVSMWSSAAAWMRAKDSSLDLPGPQALRSDVAAPFAAPTVTTAAAVTAAAGSSAPALAVCGNGIVEGEETCDDASSCCDASTCRLKITSQCTAASGGGSGGGQQECCNSRTCQWEPSSSSCSSGRGYCSNGRCVENSCAGARVEYCGVSASNPCKQSCKPPGSSSCSERFTAPDTIVRDGSVCSASPHSTCKAGVCTPTAGPFEWKLSEWGMCACTKGSGVALQVRTASCVSKADGGDASPSQCASLPAPSLSRPCTATSVTPCLTGTASWQPSVAWSECSKTCGGGTQSSLGARCVISRSNNGAATSAAASSAIVPDRFCASASTASLTRSCNSAPCTAQLQWRTTEWEGCSRSCGGGVRTRRASCFDQSKGRVVANEADCAALSKPSLTQSCNTARCKAHELKYGPWGPCSHPCGPLGAQVRQAFCVAATAPTKRVSTSLCGCGAGTGKECPDTAQACNTDVACPAAGRKFEWRTEGGWGDCSASRCGGGVQQRAVRCTDTSTSETVADYYCTSSAKPSSMRNCNTEPCVTHAWMADSFGPCSASCGGGVQNRAVRCRSTQGEFVDPSLCAAAGGEPKPADSQSCNTDACPSGPALTDKFEFVAADWSSCSRTCGGGTQQRESWCAQKGSLTPVDSAWCSKLTAPVATQPCNTAACTGRPAVSGSSWHAGEWSNCSAVCGTPGSAGVRHRLVRCVDATRGATAVRGDEACKGLAKPESSSVCSERACPTFWHTGPWSPCSVPCNGGESTRTVECRAASDSTGGGAPPTTALLPTDRCAHIGARPSSRASCNAFACPTWRMGAWGPCDSPCGDGRQRRESASCVDDRGTVHPDESCANADSLLALERSCQSATPCGFWKPRPPVQQVHQDGIILEDGWSPCNRACGGGNQTRELACVASVPAVLSTADVATTPVCKTTTTSASNTVIWTSAQVKPPETRACNTDACPDYCWNVRDLSSCSVPCGGGTFTGTAQCIRGSDGTVVANSLCLGDPPTEAQLTRPCNVHPCPRYVWAALSDWSACSIECGLGVQQRVVGCVDSSDPQTRVQVDPALCVASATASAAKPLATQECQIPESVCFGVEVGSEETDGGRNDVFIRLNGRCDRETGKCVCRSGVGKQGSNCTLEPQLSDVRTSMDPTSPAGSAASKSTPTMLSVADEVQIRWTSRGPVERVSLVLVASATSTSALMVEVPWYIATDIPNSGSFVWHVGRGVSLPPSSFSLALAGPTQAPSYRIVVWFSPAVSAISSASFAFSDNNPCAYRNCGRHGVCRIGRRPKHGDNERMGMPRPAGALDDQSEGGSYCECVPGFSGKQCEVDPCTTLGCSRAHSQCDDAMLLLAFSDTTAPSSVPSTAGATLCRCTDGYTGTRCQTPPAPQCASLNKCLNGADRAGVVSRLPAAGGAEVVDSCGWCQCVGGWVGADCGACGLKCLNGGTPDANCHACFCGNDSGYFGPECQCRYYVLSFRLRLPGSPQQVRAKYFSGSADAEANRASLSGTIRTDLLRAAQELEQQGSIWIGEPLLQPLDAPCVRADGVACTVVEASFRFSLECAEASAASKLMRTNAFALTSASVPPLQSSPPTLLSAYTAFASLFSDLDSVVYRGIATSMLDRSSSAPLGASDPSALDSLPAAARATDPFSLGNQAHEGGEVADGSSDGGKDRGGWGRGFSQVSTIEWVGMGAGVVVMGLLATLLFVCQRRYERRQQMRRQKEEEEARERQEQFRSTSPPPVMYSTHHPVGVGMVPLHHMPAQDVGGPSPVSPSSPPPRLSSPSGAPPLMPRSLSRNPYTFRPGGDPAFLVAPHALEEGSPLHMPPPPPPYPQEHRELQGIASPSGRC